MRQLYKLFVLCGIAALSTACYGDKGNYDYKDINEIVIDMNDNDEDQDISMGGTIEYNPTIKFVNGKGDLSRFDFKWILTPNRADLVENSYTQEDWNTVDFSWVPDMLIPNGEIRIEATDRETGLIYYGIGGCSVSSRYDSEGVMILAEKEGKTQFSFVKITKKVSYNLPSEFVVYDNVYNMENGANLPAKPISMLEHFCSDGTTIGQMLLLTENGTHDINGMDFKKEIDLAEAFDGGAYPPDFGYASSAMFMSSVDVVADAQGYLYSRIKNTSALFHSGYFLHDKLRVKGETEDLKGCILYRAPFNTLKACLVYETPKKRLLFVVDGGTGTKDPLVSNAGRPIPLHTPADAPEGFLPLENLGDAEILSISYFHATNYNYGYSIIYYKDGKTYCQEFDIEKEYSLLAYETMNPKVYEIKGLPGKPTLACPAPYYETGYVRNKLALYAVGNRLFVHDRGNPNTPVVEYIPKDKDGAVLDVFTGDFVTMDAENYDSHWVTAGLSDGRMLMLRFKTAHYPEDQVVLYDSGSGAYGNIVDVRCKLRSGNSWVVNED